MATQTPEPIQPASTNLTMEQEFTVVNYTAIAEKASKEQLLSIYRMLLVSYFSQKNYYEALLKQQWLGNIDVVNLGHSEEERRGKGTDNKAS